MKKVILFFLLFSLSAVYCFADDELSDDSESIQDNNSSSSPVVVDITQLINQINSDTGSEIETKDDLDAVIALDPELVSVTQSVQRVTAEDTSGLKAVLLSILGDYETVVTDYEYRNNNNTYYSHSISIERDYAWLCACGVFALLLYCTFRSIGGICARF